MELWFSETHENNLRAAWRIKEVLYNGKSPYQEVQVLDTCYHGRMLVLDGCVMTTERDEFVYHELISHPALLALDSPRAVCVVGGGDGGTVREVLKHSCIERVVLAEIDQLVIDVCREFFPGLAGQLDDPRIELAIGDGFDYLKQHRGEFDAVLSDSTDPVGPGAALFGSNYFALAKSALKPNGMFVTQSEGMWSRTHPIAVVRKGLREHFAEAHWYGGPIPTYPNGYWSFLLASDNPHLKHCADPARQQEIARSARYYTPELHSGLFALPRYIAESYFD